MPGPGHFEARAETYERARPPYPAQLWERLADLGLVTAGARVLELGAGTGQATGPMIDAGARVLAVEPGAELASRLRRRFPQVEVRVGTAEDVPLPTAAYEVAVAATSVHWLDLDVVVPKVHRTLVPDGWFAVWRNVFGDPSVPLTPFRERVVQIRPPGCEPPRPGPGELDTAAWVEQLTRSGFFRPRHVEQFSWSVELSSQQVHDLFTTFSNWDAAEVAEAAQAVDELGGRVLEHYVTPLIVLQSVERP